MHCNSASLHKPILYVIIQHSTLSDAHPSQVSRVSSTASNSTHHVAQQVCQTEYKNQMITGLYVLHDCIQVCIFILYYSIMSKVNVISVEQIVV